VPKWNGINATWDLNIDLDLDLSSKMEALDLFRAEILRSHVAFMPL